jgi:type IV secretion system protein VirB3
MKDIAPEGYEVPVHKALTEEILMAGAPRKFTILNGTLAAATCLGFQAWVLLPIFIGLHLIMVFLTKRDAQFFDCLIRYLRQKSFYDT